MSWRNVPLVKAVALVAATFLLMVPKALSGDATHAPDARPTTRYQPASTSVVRVTPLSPSISVVVTMPAQRAKEPFNVTLRGPDGQLRRFPVEGGREAIEYEQFVLRPGQSLTIRWATAKRQSSQTPR